MHLGMTGYLHIYDKKPITHFVGTHLILNYGGGIFFYFVIKGRFHDRKV